MTNAYYAHSGKFTLVGIIGALVVGSAAAIALSFVYGYLVQYNPFIYINIIASVGFGALMGVAAGKFLKTGKVRNNAVAITTGALVGVVGLYVSWAVWLFALLSRANQPANLSAILLQPAVVWKLIVEINKTGAWEMFHQTVSGVVLAIVWFLEAAIILTMSGSMAYEAINEHPFCERCGQWCETAKGVVLAKPAAADEVRRNMESHNFAYLEKLGDRGANASEWLRVDVDSCTKCRTTNALTASEVMIEIKKGKESEKSSAVVSGLLLSQGEYDSVRQLGYKMKKSASAAT